MPKNPFNFKDEHVSKPNRSNFDLSHNNHLSIGFGKIYPVFCEQCYPGDSFDIKAAFGLDAMPMVFPVQSSVRAHLHFFWVPNRILWDDWENYIYNTLDPSDVPHVIPPYIDLSTSSDAEIEKAKKFFATSGLADYLDVPTTIAGFYGRGYTSSFERYDGDVFIDFDPRANIHSAFPHSINTTSSTSAGDAFTVMPFYYYDSYSSAYNTTLVTSVPVHTFQPHLAPYSVTPNNIPISQRLDHHIHALSDGDPQHSGATPLACYGLGFLSKVFKPEDGELSASYINFFLDLLDVNSYAPFYINVYRYVPNRVSGHTLRSYDNLSSYELVSGFVDSSVGTAATLLTDANEPRQVSVAGETVTLINNILNSGHAVRIVIYTVSNPQQSADVTASGRPFFTALGKSSLGLGFSITSSRSEVVDLSEEDIRFNPFVEDSNGNIPRPISALPFRAYEAICNLYFRNEKVNPFMINGTVKYNRWNTTTKGGSDSTPYDFFYRNWELDAYTGCLPSPQSGVAPVVGMTALGNITIQDENGITTAKASIDNNGTITDVVLTSPAASDSHARTAMNIAAAGMSISDFRATNALQRYLEKAIRRSYNFSEQTLAHFGIKPEYNKLDMPVFIGGISKNINVQKVVQNTPADGMPLGSFAGIGSIMGMVDHNIRHYCDEHGFIMGLLCITPIPSYSQILPKHYTYLNNHLDYYSPEFGNALPMQPITYNELCPIQAYAEELATQNPVLNATFGYQRPYHEMVRRVDTVHSLMRTSLRDYLINRIFNVRPQLGYDFITCKPEDCNDVFSVTLANDDKFVGQVSLQIYAKRPLPRTSLPYID